MSNPNLVNASNIETKCTQYLLDATDTTIIANKINSNQLIKITSLIASNLETTEGVEATTVYTNFSRNTTLRGISYVDISQQNSAVIISELAPIYLEEGDSLNCYASLANKVSIVANFQIISELPITYDHTINKLYFTKAEVNLTSETFTVYSKAVGWSPGVTFEYVITGVTSADISGASLTGTLVQNGSLSFTTSATTSKTFTISMRYNGQTLSSASITFSESLFPFTSFQFTSANLTGAFGPTLSQALAAYDTATYSWLNNTAFYNIQTQGIQEFTVPISGNFDIEARGGDGGIFAGDYFSPGYAGAGALIKARFSLIKGTKLYIVVGQRPSSATLQSPNYGSAGGGGTFVYKGNINTSVGSDADLLICAGGGGGTGHGNTPTTGGNGKGGSSTTNSREADLEETFGINARTGRGSEGNLGIGLGGRGTGPYGPPSYGGSGGGAGWKGAGENNRSVYSFDISRRFDGYGGGTGAGGSIPSSPSVARFNGGQNSNDGALLYGGWGGGGGSDGNGNAGGGGGGYTGGGAGRGFISPKWGGGGGGGSYINSTASTILAQQGDDGINVTSASNGWVTITKI